MKETPTRERPANRSVIFKCPFYKWDSPTQVHGECGAISFGDKNTATEFMKEYCCDKWHECQISKALFKSYDRRGK